MLAIPDAVTMRPRPWGIFMKILIRVYMARSRIGKDYVDSRMRATRCIDSEIAWSPR
jgi:hypothetical protein